jgi:hypothetical protein
MSDPQLKQYLSSGGRLITIPTDKPIEGLLASFWNEPSRGREWKMLSACFHRSSGDYSLTDEKGQVFYCSMENNLYHLVRSASSLISAMEFVQSRQNQLVLSYEQNITVVVDTVSREIIQNVQVQSEGVVRMMRTHPRQPLLALATDSQVVEMWDLKYVLVSRIVQWGSYMLNYYFVCRTCHLTRTLDCVERIMHIDFIHHGSLLLVVLEHTGAYLYRSDDWSLVTRCSVPIRFDILLP